MDFIVVTLDERGVVFGHPVIDFIQRFFGDVLVGICNDFFTHKKLSAAIYVSESFA